MFQQKIPKSQQPDKTSYTVYNCHDCVVDGHEFYRGKNIIRILSIDPGLRNFCFRIEVRDYLNRTITPLAYEKYDLTGSTESNKVRIDYIYRNVITLLNRFYNIINECDLVIIERQMITNYKMIRFSQHIISYLMVKLNNNPIKTIIMEIDSKLKSQQLKAPKFIDKRDVKKWSIQKAIELATIRSDYTSLNIINTAKGAKKDDFADTLVQIESFLMLFNLPTTYDMYNGQELTITYDQIVQQSSVVQAGLLYNPNYSTGIHINEDKKQVSVNLPAFLNESYQNQNPITVNLPTMFTF